MDVEGIDGQTAARIIAMDKQLINPLPYFPGLEDKIQAAYDGLHCVTEDC